MEQQRAPFGWRKEGYFVRTVGDVVTGDIVKRYIARHRDDAPIEEEDPGPLDVFR